MDRSRSRSPHRRRTHHRRSRSRHRSYSRERNHYHRVTRKRDYSYSSSSESRSRSRERKPEKSYYRSRDKSYDKHRYQHSPTKNETTTDVTPNNNVDKVITDNMSDEDFLKVIGLDKGFKSTKGKKVVGNIDGYSKVKTTGKIFNLLIKKRGTFQQPIVVNLKK
ncbi:hypothetical protein QTN25_000190 [Entamoeba marina]